jgi:hypothetical protein
LYVLYLYYELLSTAQSKEFFLDRLKRLEQWNHKCVWSSGGICRVNNFFFNPIVCCFLYKAKDLSTLPPRICPQDQTLDFTVTFCFLYPWVYFKIFICICKWSEAKWRKVKWIVVEWREGLMTIRISWLLLFSYSMIIFILFYIIVDVIVVF